MRTAVFVTVALMLAGCAERPAPLLTDEEAAVGQEVQQVQEDITLQFASTARNGTTPLQVRFNAALTGGDDITWAFRAGDGGLAVSGGGDSFPFEAYHTYTRPGTHTATFEVDVDGKHLAAQLNITVTRPPAGEDPPQAQFDFGPTILGCGASNTFDICPGLILAQNMGNHRDDVDGWWVPVTPEYWGVEFVTQSDIQDTDCYTLDDDYQIIGEHHDGPRPCTGFVDDGSVWIYYFPWMTPAGEGHMTFLFKADEPV